MIESFLYPICAVLGLLLLVFISIVFARFYVVTEDYLGLLRLIKRILEVKAFAEAKAELEEAKAELGVEEVEVEEPAPKPAVITVRSSSPAAAPVVKKTWSRRKKTPVPGTPPARSHRAAPKPVEAVAKAGG